MAQTKKFFDRRLFHRRGGRGDAKIAGAISPTYRVCGSKKVRRTAR
jgi:hypothetical protein